MKYMSDFEVFSERLFYVASTGKLFWKEVEGDTPKKRMFNTKFAGKEAGSLNGWGYLQFSMKFRGKQCWFRCHRVAWLLHTGEWPKEQIDHINGVRTDNRIENLRSVSSSDNRRNVSVGSRNTSGCLGVWKCSKSVSWVAEIRVRGVKVTIGRYPTKSEAIKARKEAERYFGFHENHGRVNK